MRIAGLMTIGLILSLGGLFAQESGDIPFTQADANGKLQKKSLPDDASAFRLSLGLGGAALLDVGTGAGTVAAGNDARLSNNIKTNVVSQSISGTGNVSFSLLNTLSFNAIALRSNASEGDVYIDVSSMSSGGSVRITGSKVEFRAEGWSPTTLYRDEDGFVFEVDSGMFNAGLFILSIEDLKPWDGVSAKEAIPIATREWSNTSSQTFVGRKQATGQPGQNGNAGTVANTDLATAGWANSKFLPATYSAPSSTWTLDTAITSFDVGTIYNIDWIMAISDIDDIGTISTINIIGGIGVKSVTSGTTLSLAAQNNIHLNYSSNATITAVSNGEAGKTSQIINIHGSSVITIQNNANIKVRGGADLVLNPGEGATVYHRSTTTVSVW